MTDSDDQHVSRRELRLELRSFRNEVRLLIVGAVVVTNFDLPTPITATALLALAAKSGWAFLARS